MSLNCVRFIGDYGYVFVDLKLNYFTNLSWEITLTLRRTD
jgi:hypothetical protein